MESERNKMAERILNLTLKIIYQFTGEDYTVVKKTSSGRCQDPLYKRFERTLSLIPAPPPPPIIQEEINKQKILELTNQMIDLLIGEVTLLGMLGHYTVPIRCQDVAVYFSIQEWDYFEGHEDLYKEIKAKDHQPLTSAGRSSKRTTPERCPSPLLPQDDQSFHQSNDNNMDSTAVMIEEDSYVRGDEEGEEDIPTGDRPVQPSSAYDLNRERGPQRIHCKDFYLVLHDFPKDTVDVGKLS
ncbi:uncharacterized protein LOC142189100 [Leptodactylus fuscus]|uniref:uncharacterized protein LOC142189100 n=1 Tax=Leptodactylus fuscus TaxID=238119 RepID=UPI003F4F026D